MGYEIDFLPVGNGEKSGDAIAVRYGEPGNYKIMIVDGGTKESGESLVEHVKKYYETDYVDYVVNTHPDIDHVSGLTVILEELNVGELWMHQPWEHSDRIRDAFKDGRITDDSLSERLRKAFNTAHKLKEIADEKAIPVYEPFQGSYIGNFIVLSPTKSWYEELLIESDKTPEQKEGKGMLGEAKEFEKQIIEKAFNFIEETWDYETLREDVKTSAINETSTVLYANLDGNGVLLTGDAGIRALNKAADYSELIGIDLRKASFQQIPHHGGRHNVSPSVLDRIVGEKIEEGVKPNKSVFVSVSAKSPRHPKKAVTNAYKRRGAKVFSTEGITKHHFKDMPDRGWTKAQELPFYDEVEDWN